MDHNSVKFNFVSKLCVHVYFVYVFPLSVLRRIRQIFDINLDILFLVLGLLSRCRSIIGQICIIFCNIFERLI